MSEKKEKRSKHVFLIIMIVISLITSIFTIYNIFLFEGIESLIRYIVIGLFIIIDLIILYKGYRYKSGKAKKKSKKIIFILLLIIYSIICSVLGYALFYFYGMANSVNKQDVTYTSYLVVRSDSAVNKIENASNLKLGLLDDESNPDGYIIPLEMINKYKLQDSNEIVDYDDYTSMLADLYAKDIDGMFIPSGYVSMFSSITGYENIETDTKVIGKQSKKMKKAATSKVETSSSGKSVTEPFTILLMGIDSTDEVLEKNAVANGDTLILITFNPKTLNATMLSIPRDSYIPIACWSGKPENKITHAAAYGNDCMINTIQNYFDITIDYYAKINFKGLVKLVDAVGGVEVDVPKYLCTDDSSRWSQVCIQPGRQTLNGEEALVFARNRHDLENGDFGRAKHQQEIIMALINKMKDIKDVSTFMKILDTISNSMDTNLTTKQILSFYNIGKDIIKKSLSSDDAELITIQQLYLQGIGQMIYDERARMVLWDYIPNKTSRSDIINAMNVNLEKIGHSAVKTFSFSINTPYVKEVIGEGPYRSSDSYKLLPDFTGDTMEKAKRTASEYGVSVKFIGTSGTVVSQSEPYRRRVDLIKGDVTLTLSGGVKDKDKDDELDDDKDKDDDKDDDVKPTPSIKPSPSPEVEEGDVAEKEE